SGLEIGRDHFLENRPLARIAWIDEKPLLSKERKPCASRVPCGSRPICDAARSKVVRQSCVGVALKKPVRFLSASAGWMEHRSCSDPRRRVHLSLVPLIASLRPAWLHNPHLIRRS